MAITTTSLLSAPVQQTFSLKLLSVPVPSMIHKLPAMLKQLPRNGGTTLRMRRYNPLPTALVPLGNSGITPPPATLSAVDIDAKMSFYGLYVQINEQVTLQNQDPVLNECSRRLGVSLRQTEDELTRNMLAATASAVYATGGLNGDSPTDPARSDIDSVVKTLVGNNAYTIFDNIEGQDRFGTGPVRDSFISLCHSDLIGTLDAISGFIHKNNYPAPNEADPSEWGSIGNLRFMVSSIGSYFANRSALGANVYNLFCVGMEAYACVLQDGYSASFIYRPPILDSALALNCTVGYKFAEVPRICNDLWLLNLQCTLPT